MAARAQTAAHAGVRPVSILRGFSPWRVALVVLLFHALWIGAYFAAGHDVRDFIKIGPRFVTQSHASSVIRYDPTYAYPQNHDVANAGQGFDGQFAYYIALDPSRAHHYLDEPSYRYQRILYPMASRVAALARPKAVPWAMLAINWLAVGLGVLALAGWLRRKGASPWFAALYGLFPGMLVALQRDLNEPLAYALVAIAVYLFDFGGRRGVLLAGLAFGLAALARETTLVFALLFGGSILLGRPNASSAGGQHERVRQALRFGALAFVPIAAWLAADWAWLGAPSTPRGDLTLIPLAGAFQTPFKLSRQPVDLVFVVLPALICAAVALHGLLRRRAGALERLCLLANVLFMIVLASGSLWISYSSIGRVSVAIVLAAVLCVPYLRLRPPWRRSGESAALGPRLDRTAVALGSAAVLWMAILPGVLAYGFSDIKV